MLVHVVSGEDARGSGDGFDEVGVGFEVKDVNGGLCLGKAESEAVGVLSSEGGIFDGHEQSEPFFAVRMAKNAVFWRVFPGVVLGNASKVFADKGFGFRAIHGYIITEDKAVLRGLFNYFLTHIPRYLN